MVVLGNGTLPLTPFVSTTTSSLGSRLELEMPCFCFSCCTYNCKVKTAQPKTNAQKPNTDRTISFVVFICAVIILIWASRSVCLRKDNSEDLTCWPPGERDRSLVKNATGKLFFRLFFGLLFFLLLRCLLRRYEIRSLIYRKSCTAKRCVILIRLPRLDVLSRLSLPRSSNPFTRTYVTYF